MNIASVCRYYCSGLQLDPIDPYAFLQLARQVGSGCAVLCCAVLCCAVLCLLRVCM